MKNKFNILTLAVGLVVAGCSNKLEEIKPQQSISDALAFADEAGARGATIGVYGLSQDLEVLGSMPQIIADYQSDNVNFIGSFPTLNAINDYVTLADNTSINGIWRDNYEVVLAANAVIANVPNVPGDGFTSDERNQLIAEAKFLRAIVNFNMVNLFAHPFQVSGGTNDGVPLINDPFTGEVILYSRATVNALHAQIQLDLEDAIAGLPGDALGTTRATAGAANLLLSRLHLYREEWADAAEHAALITGNASYTPATDYSFYTGGGGDYLFALANTAVDNGETGSGGWNSYYEPAEQGGRGDCPFSANLVSAYTAGDARLALSEIGDNGQRYTLKFDDAATDVSFSPVARIGEAYLNHAEALANTSATVTQAMVDLLNVTRERAGLTANVIGDFADVAAFRTAVLEERRLELAFEGHRRMDLLRTRQALRPAGDPNFAESGLGDDMTIMPIPQRERDLNPNLTQNTGY